VAGIEDLKEKREEVNRQILKDEEEKQKIQNDLRILTERSGAPACLAVRCSENSGNPVSRTPCRALGTRS
jgi:hypothetical protein